MWGSAVPWSTRTWLLTASVLLRPMCQVQGGLKPRQVGPGCLGPGGKWLFLPWLLSSASYRASCGREDTLLAT